MSKSKKRSHAPQTVVEALPVASVEVVDETKKSLHKKKKNSNSIPSNITPNIHTEINTVEDALKTLKKILQGLKPLKGFTLTQFQDWCKIRCIEIPWPADLSPAKEFCGALGTADELIFDFEAPQSIAIAGSFMLKTSLANDESNVDLIVEQPEGLIFRYENGAKDHINWRYWLRRTFFLVVCYDAIKKALKCTKTEVSMHFEKLHGNPYKSIIVIKFLEGGFDRFIRIVPSIPFSDQFKTKIFRLSPQRSNVRSNWLQSWMGSGGSKDSISQSKTQNSTAIESPTAFHNYSLLSEALYLPHLIYLHSSLKNSTVLVASIKMVKAWLKQSGISSITSINGFIASMWLVDMVNRNEINPTIMDELQIFKFVLKSWIKAFDGISPIKNEFKMKLSGFKEEFEGFNEDSLIPEISLLAGPMNLFYATNLNSLQRLSQAATSTLSFLVTHPDRLDRIFLSSMNCELFTQDLTVEFKNVHCEDIKGLPVGVIQNYANVLSSGYLEGRIALVLKKGLTDRYRGPINIKIVKSLANKFNIKIGITFNSHNNNFERSIDLGPISEDLEGSAKFRGFWGSKSELRQFKDSAIRECVSWESVKNKSTIPKEIISWLFARHFGLKLSCDSSKQLEFFNSASDYFTKFSGIFDGLSRELRGLNQVLPLTIVQCVGLSPAHRHTSLQIPLARAELSQEFPSSLLPSPSCPVYDFLIRFERSAAWPDERQALQSARQAFLLQLNRTIRSRKIVEASLVAAEYIDIYYKGFVFRGWIEVPREELRCRAEGLIVEAESIERRTFWQPRLSNILHQITSRHGAFSETCRLIKSFLSGHLLDLDEDLIDVLSALVFLESEDQTGSGKAAWVGSLLQNCPVGSALTGFLRFLDLLVNFPWTERPLILDFSSFESFALDQENSSINQIEEIDAMKLFDWSVLLRTDRTNAISIIPIFTHEHKAMIINSIGTPELSSLIPTLPIDKIENIALIRCKLLARLTLEHLNALTLTSESDVVEIDNFSLQGLFKMSIEAICSDFDVLIKLDSEQIQLTSDHHIEGITRIFRNSPQPSPLLFSALPGFSAPNRLVHELSGPLKVLGATIAYNRSNPILLAVRIKDIKRIDEIIEIIRKIGADLILDIKITRN